MNKITDDNYARYLINTCKLAAHWQQEPVIQNNCSVIQETSKPFNLSNPRLVSEQIYVAILLSEDFKECTNVRGVCYYLFVINVK